LENWWKKKASKTSGEKNDMWTIVADSGEKFILNNKRRKGYILKKHIRKETRRWWKRKERKVGEGSGCSGG